MHVDNIIIAGSSADCDALIRFLRKMLPTNNFGKRSARIASLRRLGMGDIDNKQHHCIDQLLHRFDISSKSPIPACSSVEVRARQEGEKICIEPYRNTVGSLLWLINATRWTFHMLFGESRDVLTTHRRNTGGA